MLARCLLVLSLLIIIGAQSSDNFTCLIANCSNCLSPSQCNQCLSGSILIGGACAYCPNVINACLFCNITAPHSQPSCFACQNGYYLNNTNCLPCSFPCATCSNPDTCISCLQGLYLNQANNQCRSCQVLNCGACNWPGNCTSCLPSYYLNGSQCLPCGYGCLQCDQYQCLICQPAYSTSIPCIPCVPNCQSCPTAQSCVVCSYGYILGNVYFNPQQGCLSCSNYIFNCASCTQGYYEIVCNACMEGYYLNVTGNFSSFFFITCLPCQVTNCAYCVGEPQGTLCVFCMEGFYLDSNNSCISCPVGCSSCYNSSSCSYCSTGYYSLGPLCVQCLQNCQNCNQSTCLFCHTPYFPVNNSCVDCNNAIPNCSQCFQGSCLVCNLGFYLSAPTSCLPCQSNCEICTDGTTCQTCFLTFYLQKGSCVSCYPCSTCVNSSYCITCPPGVNIDGSNCPICPNCLECFYYGCIQCANKHIIQLSNNQCISIYELNALRWWQSLLILVVSLVGVHFAGNAVIWLRNRTDGYLGEEENNLVVIELQITESQ